MPAHARYGSERGYDPRNGAAGSASASVDSSEKRGLGAGMVRTMRQITSADLRQIRAEDCAANGSAGEGLRMKLSESDEVVDGRAARSSRPKVVRSQCLSMKSGLSAKALKRWSFIRALAPPVLAFAFALCKKDAHVCTNWIAVTHRFRAAKVSAPSWFVMQRDLSSREPSATSSASSRQMSPADPWEGLAPLRRVCASFRARRPALRRASWASIRRGHGCIVSMARGWQWGRTSRQPRNSGYGMRMRGSSLRMMGSWYGISCLQLRGDGRAYGVIENGRLGHQVHLTTLATRSIE